jgi:hypothetical protein
METLNCSESEVENPRLLHRDYENITPTPHRYLPLNSNNILRIKFVEKSRPYKELNLLLVSAVI